MLRRQEIVSAYRELISLCEINDPRTRQSRITRLQSCGRPWGADPEGRIGMCRAGCP